MLKVAMLARYDTIGRGYARLRRPDPRIAARIEAALGPAHRILNVGAGAGSYEPPEREVIAVEPSATMIAQRPPGAAPVVRAVAEALPFPDRAFDAAMAVLTTHHWGDVERGLSEMRRVTRGPIVILTFVPNMRDLWQLDYFPQIGALDARDCPTPERQAAALPDAKIVPVSVPGDCTDGFLYAYWRCPEAYLDPQVRAAISSFHAFEPRDGLIRLASDLEDGTWDAKYGHLRELDSLDCGYRLITSG